MNHRTLTIAYLPTSQTVVILVGIFTNPATFGGGGSPQFHCIPTSH